MAAEGLVFHLILGGGWLAWAISARHVYSLIWLWGYALGARAFPHRVTARAAIPVLLASRRRVDVLIELSEPIRVQRPFQDPLFTRSLAVASDDPEDLIARLLAPDPAGAGVWSLAWTAELATLARDAAQPG